MERYKQLFVIQWTQVSFYFVIGFVSVITTTSTTPVFMSVLSIVVVVALIRPIIKMLGEQSEAVWEKIPYENKDQLSPWQKYQLFMSYSYKSIKMWFIGLLILYAAFKGYSFTIVVLAGLFFLVPFSSYLGLSTSKK